MRSLLLVALLPAMAAAQSTMQVVEYYTTDAIGSVRAVTKQVNGQWQVVARHDFMPFGEEVAAPSPPQDKRLFTGKERDAETGQNYFGARYYRTNIGRFTTVDPAMDLKENLVDPQRWNRYAYALDNPLRYTDPDGKFPVAVAAAIPGPQQPFVIAGVAMVGAVVVASSPTVRQAVSSAWMTGIQILSDGMAKARDHFLQSTDGGQRSFSDQVRDVKQHPEDWKRVSAHTEESTRKGGRQGGASTQEVFENKKTGERVVKHTVVDDRGKVVDQHFRPEYKPGSGEPK
jgi:RHS repeat-associated protein